MGLNIFKACFGFFKGADPAPGPAARATPSYSSGSDASLVASSSGESLGSLASEPQAGNLAATLKRQMAQLHGPRNLARAASLASTHKYREARAEYEGILMEHGPGSPFHDQAIRGLRNIPEIVKNHARRCEPGKREALQRLADHYQNIASLWENPATVGAMGAVAKADALARRGQFLHAADLLEDTAIQHFDNPPILQCAISGFAALAKKCAQSNPELSEKYAQQAQIWRDPAVLEMYRRDGPPASPMPLREAHDLIARGKLNDAAAIFSGVLRDESSSREHANRAIHGLKTVSKKFAEFAERLALKPGRQEESAKANLLSQQYADLAGLETRVWSARLGSMTLPDTPSKSS